ncbi:hypothetical protein [uncultured Clostridium sp.]|uniref:hypothetical protein n=1 Tax=uncultured Clostridium sp. TaxID=59620 RepID=UPI0025D2CC05|nr:hypothetical protein [uncultured Clostridium sp.]
MNNSLIPITLTHFRDNVSIRFNNILDGLNKFSNFTIDGTLIENSEETIINYLTEIFKENDNECYIDFYINRLDDCEINRLINLLPEEDKLFLHNIISINHNDIYYKITNKNLIPFFTRMNTRELFFVTLYFTKKPVTIWGNYDFKFPCFFNNSDILNHYYNMAEKYNLIE